MAFQAPSLLPWRTTVDNVLLPLEIVEPYRSNFKAKRQEYEERARKLVQKVGLGGYEDKFPWQLSGGMQQRASICRALIHEPKMLLLVVALAAAYVAAQKPADILFLVSAAFSFAAASFFPALTLGIFWKRATKWGAVLGMVGGLGVTMYYMVTTQPWLRGIFNVTSPVELWWGIQPISAGVFGVPLGFAIIIVVSLLTPAPRREIQDLVEHVRYPSIAGDIDTRAA
jgi:hypothetical protein